MKINKVFLGVIASVSGLMTSSFVAADQITTSIEAGTETHDNINKTSADKETDTEEYAALKVGVSEDYTYGDLNLDYKLMESVYQDNSYEDRATSTGYGVGTVYILPGRFFWMADHLREDMRVYSFVPDIPTNRTLKTSSATGPSLYFDITSVDRLKLALRYTDTEFSDIEIKNTESVMSSMAWIHRISNTELLYVVASQTQVEYDFGIFDYENNNYRIDYVSTWRKSTTRFMAGRNDYKPEFFGEDSSGLSYEISIDYKPTETESIFGSAGRKFSGSADSDSEPASSRGADLDAPDIGFDLSNDFTIDSESNTAQFDLTHVDVGLTKEFGDPNQLVVGAGLKKYDYVVINLDQQEEYFSILFSRTINENTKIRFLAGYEELDYGQLMRSDEGTYLGVSLNYKINEDLTFNGFVLERENQSSINGKEYGDLSLGLALKYLLL